MCTAICKQTKGATCIYKAYFRINNSKYTCIIIFLMTQLPLLKILRLIFTKLLWSSSSKLKFVYKHGQRVAYWYTYVHDIFYVNHVKIVCFYIMFKYVNFVSYFNYYNKFYMLIKLFWEIYHFSRYIFITLFSFADR